MTAAAPATKSNELIEEANSFLLGLTHHCDPANWMAKRLQHEAGKLMHVDAFSSHLLLGKVHEFCGEAERMVHHYKNAMQIGSPTIAAGFLSAGKCNLGYFAEAQAYFSLAGNAESGLLPEDFRLGLACFGFMKTSEYLKVAKKMQLDLAGYPTDLVRRAVNVMNAAGLRDADLAEMLDIAGEVMRENRLFYQNDLPDIEIDDQSDTPCIYATYRFGVSVKEAADLYDEMVERLVNKVSVIPDAFHIRFRAD